MLRHVKNECFSRLFSDFHFWTFLKCPFFKTQLTFQKKVVTIKNRSNIHEKMRAYMVRPLKYHLRRYFLNFRKQTPPLLAPFTAPTSSPISSSEALSPPSSSEGASFLTIFGSKVVRHLLRSVVYVLLVV